MIRISDEQLDDYADRFMALRLARHGWTLTQYLAAPAAGEERALEPEPPLAAQRRVALRLWQQQDTGLGAPSGTPHDDIRPCWRELLAQWRPDIERREASLGTLPTCHNGAAIEPMRHHRHARKRNANARFKQKGA